MRKKENMGSAAPERSNFNRILSGIFFTSAILNFMFFKSSISLFLPFPLLLLGKSPQSLPTTQMGNSTIYYLRDSLKVISLLSDSVSLTIK